MKRIAIFCDGTWNSADQEKNGEPCPTNVIKLALRTARRAGTMPQLVFYDQGVGTGGSLDKLTGGAFGRGLDDNLYEAYRFLVLNYEPGDELFLFGFSRGAYTARSLAGMIRKCGILRLRHARRYREAISLYCDDHHPDDGPAQAFRKECSVTGNDPVPIRFMGVWDTVGALGIPVRGLRALTAHKYRFHDVELSGIAQHACHALAIDERRAPFEPAIWAYQPKDGQVVEQVWFCGVHSDIGGGYPPQESGLSDIALEWMRGRARVAGLAIDAEVDATHALNPDPMATPHDSKTGLYRLTPGKDRVIGVVNTPEGKTATGRDPTQSLHPSVLRRWDEDPRYRPDNLRAYLRMIGDPRAEA